MAAAQAEADKQLTGRERRWDPKDFLVSKTDTGGRITYANRTFMEISDYREAELLGAPHKILRHPDMPACIFQFLWEEIQAGREVFAYILNRCKYGDHYWVAAHVTPSFQQGQIVGYHSNRRAAPEKVIQGTVWPLYQKLRAREREIGGKKGMRAARQDLDQLLADQGLTMRQWFFSQAGAG